MKDLKYKVKQLILRYSLVGLEAEVISDDMNLVDELGYDSMSFTMLILDLENEFGITINPEIMLFENFSTPQKIINIIVGEINAKSSG